MNNKFYKGISIGILICLILIVLKQSNIPTSIGVEGIDNIGIIDYVIQISPNKIGVVGVDSILVFDYNDNTKTFDYQGSFDYSDYFRHPEKYGIPYTPKP